jgi:signal transduction histidine kinase
LEGWLRIKIKLDAAFRDTGLGLYMNSWAASEVYVDGNLLNTFGNTGINGEPFKEFSPIYQFPVPVNIEKNNQHTIAVHFVDFLSPLPPYHLKSEERLRYFVSITSPEFITEHFSYYMQERFYRTMLLSVNAILCLLFWLLAFQNPVEKNLLLIGATTTLLTLLLYCETYSSPGVSFFVLKFFALVAPILRAIVMTLIIVLMLRIFKRKITTLFKIAVSIILIGAITQLYSETYIILILQASLILFLYAYYIITSWKTLKGAQWAVLTGVLVCLSFGLLLATSSLVNPELNYSLVFLYYSGLFLSFPLSLLVYVALRFREIIREVRQNAKQVVQLSDEKKQQAVNQQKILQEEVNRQTAELRNTLDDLKSTQSQLIQSEKMASLGELTAGIAHEIQNPLNFVNNFSEVSNELLDEMKTELTNDNKDDAMAIADDIKQNLEKILHHGKRADGIVKGMLQHSRSSSGVKEPSDINVLADEYLRLSYHGLRARDKSFNATMKTDFDDSVGKINIIPQEIGRVILNLINNAFYAVNERQKTEGLGYEPTVTVSTRRLQDRIQISVKDNGSGIPDSIKEKIFQPFFTTKPTGQGTGLGLSLAYDIVKAHGGEIKVETKQGEGSGFAIQLPVV